MTPRTVKGSPDLDFARQVRERNAALQPTKKYKSSAPKGSKFAAGYTDRAKAREEEADEDEKGKRIKALEEQMKLGQLSVETFEALRDEITGGDVGSTHLVKGLDRRLLERVRRGENVLGTGSNKEEESAEPPPDLDEELDKVAEKDIETVRREKSAKKGTMAPPPPVAGAKRSRDEIMAELKAQRKAAAEAKATAVPQLDANRWRKVSEKQKSRVQVDSKGREVLIMVDEDGVVKKKVRKALALASMPEMDKAVLGADAVVPEPKMPVKVAEEEDEDDDIFEGVGTEYDPLGPDVGHDEDSSDEEQDTGPRPPPPNIHTSDKLKEQTQPESPPNPPDAEAAAAPAAPRNYFRDKPPDTEQASQDHFAGIQNVLQKAAKLDPLRSDAGEDEGTEVAASNAEREARAKKHAQMLANQDRDLEDMDMGFGFSRGDDDAEGNEEGKKMRLSEWKGGAGDDDRWEEDDGKAGSKKKRKPKKRKGDASSMNDIMRDIEGRKAGGK